MLEMRGNGSEALPSPQALNNHSLSLSIIFVLPEPGAGVVGVGQIQVPVAVASSRMGEQRLQS